MTPYHDILRQADSLKTELTGLSPLKKSNEQRLWQKLRLEWNWNSNHLEGNTLTYGETMLFLIRGETIGDHKFREYREMKAHDLALDMVRQWAEDSERPLSESDIRELNRIILVEPFYKESKTPEGQPTRKLIKIGQYKQSPNSVELQNGEMFWYAEPEEVPAKMQELMGWYRNDTAGMHPLEVAALLHYQFVRIHPFDDGNGRIARLIANYHLIRSSFPPVVIKSADKTNYFNALNKADAGDTGAFIAYFAEQSLWSLDLAIRAAKGEEVEELDDWKKRLELLKKNTSGEQEVKNKTSQIISERLADSFIPLFEKVVNEMDSFKDLFAISKHDLTIFSAKALPPKGDLNNWDYLIELDKNNLLVDPQKIHLTFNWEGYRLDGENTFNIYYQVVLDLNDPFKYKIVVSDLNSPVIVKLYTKALSLEEMNLVANELGRSVMDRIDFLKDSYKPA